MCKVNVVACFSYIQELVEASFCKNARDINKSKVSKFYLFFAILLKIVKERSMENCSALLKEPLYIFGSLKAVLPES